MIRHPSHRHLALLACACFAFGCASVVRAEDSPPRKIVEIYRVAPGQHVAFLKMIAQFDQASREAGIPPRDLYVHQDGAKLDKVLVKLGLPRGANFFIEIRKYMAEHTDTVVEGPTTAEAWLRKLK